MNIFECIRSAANGLKSNKMRAFLTMLGIIIGISSVMLITTLGGIVEKKVSETYESLGTDLMYVYADYREGKTSAEIEDISDIYFSSEIREQYLEQYGYAVQAAAITATSDGGTINFKKEQLNARLDGVSEDYYCVSRTKLVKGRYIDKNDITQMRNVCVLSEKQAKKLFGKKNPIGQKIEIVFRNGITNLTVVGVVKPSTSGLMQSLESMMGSNDWSSGIIVPLSVAEEGQWNPGYYSQICISGNGEMTVEELAQKSADFFNNTYFRNNENFHVVAYTAQEELTMVNDVMGVVSLVITIIAGISLLVGGIGVMNIMLVSVTERTREIGVRKALGAPNSAIRMQFIVESIIICLIGGAIGIVLGFVLGNIGGIIAECTVAPDPFMVFVSVAFSMAIGVFFGFYPANKAAKMDPIDALRYE